MAKTTLKEVVQDGLPILADITDIVTTWSANDASGFLKDGAILLCVAKVEGDSDDGPFRFALGWPRNAGEPPELWKRYDHAAGQR
ncbi:MAG TPA: hypothetical protein VHC20_06600 [Candidatus Paceibacterota bacterium]|nr:hypothetical protein [Candidatus Paceibacterota bacterium]